MFLHIFVADIALNPNNQLLTKQCIGLKLSVLNEEDLAEYSIFTEQEKEELLFKFQQTIQIPLNTKKLLARSQYNNNANDARTERERLLKKGQLTEHTMLLRLRFTVSAVYRASSSQQTVQLGYGTIVTKVNDETISKTIVLQESQLSMEKNLHGSDSYHVIGKLYVTMFYHSTSIDIGENPSFLYDGKYSMPDQQHQSAHDSHANRKKSVNEYSFLLSRKLRKKDEDQMVTFDHLLESRLSKDAKWYQESKVNNNINNSKQNKTATKKVMKSPSNGVNTTGRTSSPAKRVSSSGTTTSLFLSPRSQQIKKAASSSAGHNVAPSDPPKLRKTHMSVGYVKNEWPEPHNKTADMEKRIYQLQLMNEKKLKLIAQIAKEIEQKYSKKEKESTSSSLHVSYTARSVQQRKEEAEREQQEKLLRKQLKHQASEVKNLELQLTKLRLESALSYSSQPPVESKHSNRHNYSSNKAPFETFGGKAESSSTLLHRLVNDLTKSEKKKKKKKRSSANDLSTAFNERDALQRLISTEAIKEKLNKPLKSNAMSHTTSSAIRATSPAKPILVSPSPSKQDFPKFVKSSIIDSLASKEKEKKKRESVLKSKPVQNNSKSSPSQFAAAATTAFKNKQAKLNKAQVNKQSESHYADDAVDDYWLSYHGKQSAVEDNSPSNIIRVSVSKLQQQRSNAHRHQESQYHLARYQSDTHRYLDRDTQIRGYLDSSDEEMENSDDWFTRENFTADDPVARNNDDSIKQEEEMASPKMGEDNTSSDFEYHHENYSYFPQEQEFSHDNILFNNFISSKKSSAMENLSNTLRSNPFTDGDSSNSSTSDQDKPLGDEVDEEAQSIESDAQQSLQRGLGASSDTKQDLMKHGSDSYYEKLAKNYKIPGFLQTLVMDSTKQPSFTRQSPSRSPMERSQATSPLIHPHQDEDFSDDDDQIMRNHYTKKNTLANMQSNTKVIDKETLVVAVESSSFEDDKGSSLNKGEQYSEDDEDQKMFHDLMNGISDDDTIENVVATASAVKSIGVIGKRKSEDSLTPTPTPRTSSNKHTSFMVEDPDQQYWIGQMNSSSTIPLDAGSNKKGKPSQPVVHRSANDRIRNQFEKNRQVTAAMRKSEEQEKQAHIDQSDKNTTGKQAEVTTTLSDEAKTNFMINGKNEHRFEDKRDKSEVVYNGTMIGGNYGTNISTGRSNRSDALKRLEKNRQYQNKVTNDKEKNVKVQQPEASPFANVHDEPAVSPSLSLSSPAALNGKDR